MDPKLLTGVETHRITHINRSGDEPYRLLMNKEGDTLRTKIGGSWVFRDAVSFWQRVLNECQNNQLSKAVVIFQLQQQMNPKEAYMLARRANELFADKRISLAVVDMNGCSFCNPNFWQMAAANSGFSSFFHNVAEAELWLGERMAGD